MTMTPSVINKLILARHLFMMSLDNLKSHREIALFATVNLMQDAVEAFLLGAAEHVHAAIDSSTGFERYFDKIEATGQKLSFRSKLVALNKVRVNAKHYGVKPDRREVEGFAVVCREFFEETCASILDVPFWSISLIDLLGDGEVKELLNGARTAFDKGSYWACLVECRKTIFILFERDYDVEKFRDGKPPGLLGVGFSDAPHFAQNQRYIDEKVNDPFDYIVLDHNKLTNELMKDGIDADVFWNIWRLTPAVYRYRAGFAWFGADNWAGDWIVKNEVAKQANATEEHASYVLENTIDIALRMDQRKRLVRGGHLGGGEIALKRDGVPIYRKADRNSEVVMTTESGLRTIKVNFSTVGLKGDAVYWYASHIEGGIGDETTPRIYTGYIHEDDVC